MWIKINDNDISHILIEIENRTFDEWVSLVQDIRTRLSAGESFEALAVELSDDAASARRIARRSAPAARARRRGRRRPS